MNGRKYRLLAFLHLHAICENVEKGFLRSDEMKTQNASFYA